MQPGLSATKARERRNDVDGSIRAFSAARGQGPG